MQILGCSIYPILCWPWLHTVCHFLFEFRVLGVRRTHVTRRKKTTTKILKAKFFRTSLNRSLTLKTKSCHVCFGNNFSQDSSFFMRFSVVIYILSIFSLDTNNDHIYGYIIVGNYDFYGHYWLTTKFHTVFFFLT